MERVNSLLPYRGRTRRPPSAYRTFHSQICVSLVSMTRGFDKEKLSSNGVMKSAQRLVVTLFRPLTSPLRYARSKNTLYTFLPTALFPGGGVLVLGQTVLRRWCFEPKIRDSPISEKVLPSTLCISFNVAAGILLYMFRRKDAPPRCMLQKSKSDRSALIPWRRSFHRPSPRWCRTC